MPTPSIQTLRTDAQQVLNLDSISAVRSVVAATLANANAGTPLNPNLTTQQLWNEFYQIVTQPKSDIESIIANQLMKFMYAPPAPGGVGADKQVIFNDGGVLAGDVGLQFNKTTDTLQTGALVVPGNVQLATVGTLYVGTLLNPKLKVDVGGTGVTTITEATITGALTVDTSTLVVNPAGYPDRVGIGTATPVAELHVVGGANFSDGTTTLRAVSSGNVAFLGTTTTDPLVLRVNNIEQYRIAQLGVFTWSDGAGGTAMTLNSTGLNIANGNLILGTSGKGIDFSATSGTGTSELLNDYEEGTFTPTVVGTTTAGVGTYTTQVGNYTKIGNQVIVQAYISLTAHTGTGNLRLSGLPFANSAQANSFSAVAFGFVNNLALTAGNILTGYTSVGNVFIDCYQTPTGGGAATPVPIDASFDIIYTLTYRV